jgi:hypothetical protein
MHDGIHWIVTMKEGDQDQGMDCAQKRVPTEEGKECPTRFQVPRKASSYQVLRIYEVMEFFVHLSFTYFSFVLRLHYNILLDE